MGLEPTREEEIDMPNPGTISGTHHLTFCVGTAQEDYDFHTQILGLKSVKKTALYDGDKPVYHFYYGNDTGAESTLITPGIARVGTRSSSTIRACARCERRMTPSSCPS